MTSDEVDSAEGVGRGKGKRKRFVTWADESGRRHFSKQSEIHNRPAKIGEDDPGDMNSIISTDFELDILVKRAVAIRFGEHSELHKLYCLTTNLLIVGPIPQRQLTTLR